MPFTLGQLLPVGLGEAEPFLSQVDLAFSSGHVKQKEKRNCQTFIKAT